MWGRFVYDNNMSSNIPNKNRADISAIKEEMIKHNEDDRKQFGSINKKLDEMSALDKKEEEDRQYAHEQIRNDYKQLREDIRMLSEQVQPVVKWFDNINFSKKAIMWILGILGSTIGILIGLKSLFAK